MPKWRPPDTDTDTDIDTDTDTENTECAWLLLSNTTSRGYEQTPTFRRRMVAIYRVLVLACFLAVMLGVIVGLAISTVANVSATFIVAQVAQAHRALGDFAELPVQTVFRRPSWPLAFWQTFHWQTNPLAKSSRLRIQALVRDCAFMFAQRRMRSHCSLRIAKKPPLGR